MSGRARRLLAEFLGSGLLVAVIVGSGIAAARLSPDEPGLTLLINALATALGLLVLILVFQPISGAHLNPVVSLVDASLGYRRWSDALAYVPAQLLGGVAGAVLANAMFGLAPVGISRTDRSSFPHLLAEVVATCGLVLVIFLLARTGRTHLAAPAVAAYIGAAYFFTSSTSFANPAVTVGRAFTDTFAGINPGSVPGFLAAQLAGLAVGVGLLLALYPGVDEVADAVVVAHEPATTRAEPGR